jgi:hypothetical protein
MEQMHNLFTMLGQEFSTQREKTGRHSILYPPTGWTEHFFGIHGLFRKPLPPTLGINHPTLGAKTGFRQLSSGFIRIVDALLDQSVSSAITLNIGVFAAHYHLHPSHIYYTVFDIKGVAMMKQSQILNDYHRRRLIFFNRCSDIVFLSENFYWFYQALSAH